MGGFWDERAAPRRAGLWRGDVRGGDAAGDDAQFGGPAELLDSEGCYVRSEGTLTAAVGLRDMVVVTTDDAVLVAPRGRAQDVKALVERMKAAGLTVTVEYCGTGAALAGARR